MSPGFFLNVSPSFIFTCVSINKAQAKALAEGFLDTLGSDKSGVILKNTVSEVVLIAAEMVEDMQDNLNASNSNATGNLSASIELSEPQKIGSAGLKIDVYMNYYGMFINKGVKGTKGGSGKYAFKYDKPSRKMVDAIKEWIELGKIKTRNTNAKKSTSKNEIKNASIGELSTAYAVARSIVQHGIQKTGFLDKASDNAKRKVNERLGLALKIDILDSITEKRL